MRQIIRNRDASSLSWPMSVAITVNGFSWAAYGFALKDWFLVSPNFFGGVLGVVQLSFLVMFNGGRRKKIVGGGGSGGGSDGGGGEGSGAAGIVANLSSEDLIVSGQPRSSL